MQDITGSAFVLYRKAPFRSVVLSSQLTVRMWSTDEPGVCGASMSEAGDAMCSGAGMVTAKSSQTALIPVAALVVLVVSILTLFLKFRKKRQN